ncbi:retrovirus-related pol polyprotein from transposon TNT 1-94 [Tanacetum coccineum]
MLTHQDIYAAGSENRPPMLNKDNYVPWSSRLIRYAKSKPNEKLIYNSIMHGPYTDEELTNKEVKQMEADDQAIQTILMGLSKDIYDTVDSCETPQEIWLRVQQMMKGSDIGIQEKKAKFFSEWERFTFTDGESNYNQLYDFLKFNQVEINELRAERLARTHDPLALMANSNNPYNYLVFHQDQPSQITYMQQPQPNNNYIPQPSFKQNYMKQPMINPEDIFNPTTAMNMALVLMAKAFKLNYSTPTNNNQRISSNPRNREIIQLGMNIRQDRQMQMNVGNQVVQNAVQNSGVQNVGNQNGLIVVLGIAYQNVNQNGNGNVTQLLIAQKEEAGIQIQAKEFDLMAAAGDLDEIEEVNANCILMANLLQALTSEKSTVSYLQQEKKKLKSDFKIREDELLDKQIQLGNKIKELDNILLKMGQSIQTMHMLSPKPDSFYHTEQKMALECKYDKISYDKAYNDMQQKIGQLQAQLGDLKGKSKNTPCVSDTLDPLSQKLEDDNVELEFKDTTQGTSANTKFTKQSILGKPPSFYKLKLYSITPIPNSKVIPKVGEMNALLKQVTSNSAPSTRELKVMKNDKVIALGMFRINPSKTSRENVNSNSNGVSSIGVERTYKTRRPQPRSNTKNDRVPFASKSSCIKNKDVEVKEHHRNLLLSKNKKHVSPECNNIKLVIRNDKSEVVCAMYKKCLITANHDVSVLNYVNDMNSRDDNQSVNVSNVENQKKHKPKVKKSKTLGSKERLTSSTPRKPRTCLSGKLIESSNSECQSDNSKSDNACTSNPHDPTSKRFPNSTSFLGRLSKFVYGTVRFRNDHVVEIIGYGDLKWGNILITKASHPPKPVPNSKQRLHLLHIDLFGPMRVKSINGKRYILVIVDDYSRYTWVHFLRSKDDAPEVIKTFLKKIQVLLQAPVIIVRTDNDAEFKNQVLKEYFNSVGISHQSSSVRTPQQNGGLKQLLLRATHKTAPSFTVDLTYELINGRKPDISFLHVFGALCYPNNDREDIGKLGAKGDIGFFIGYSANSYAYRVYNRRTKKIIKTMNVTFDELSVMAFE